MNCPLKNYNFLRENIYEFLNQWQWELHFTLSFETQLNSNQAYKEVKRWLKDQRHRFTKIKFACILIFANPNGNKPHVHMVAASDFRYPRRLTDIPTIILRYLASSWERDPFKDKKNLWQNRRSCKITTNNDWGNEKICRYLSKQKNISLNKPDHWQIDIYRKDVLERLKVRPLAV